MKGFAANLENETRKNTDFRRVLYTGKYSQLVLMSIRPGDEIGEETHDDRDQFFRFEDGEGKVVIDGKEHLVKDGDGIIVPAGARHNVINTSKNMIFGSTRFIPRQSTRMAQCAGQRLKRMQKRSIPTAGLPNGGIRCPPEAAYRSA